MDDNKNLNQLNTDTPNTDDYQKILDEYAASIKPEENSDKQMPQSNETTPEPELESELEATAELKEIVPDKPITEPQKLKNINSLQLEAPDNKSIPADIPEITPQKPEPVSQPLNIEPPTLDQPPKISETKPNVEPPITPQPAPTSPTPETKTPEEIKAQIDKIFNDESTSLSSAPNFSNKSNGFRNIFIISLIIFFTVVGAWIYFLFFRQNSNKSTSNTLTPSPIPTEIISEETCELNGETYQVGESFKSADGCNTCSCQTGNNIACTEMACNVTPEVIPATKSAATKLTVTPVKTTITPTKIATPSTKKVTPTSI